MKHKRRSGNPLSHYRRIQREIRDIFDPFTAKHCARCTTPCCIKPTRVTPIDVSLALGTHHEFPHLGRDPYEPAMEDAGLRLKSARTELQMAPSDTPATEPCEFLHEYRCTFPDDLRPYGCVAYICPPMYAHLPDITIKRLRYLLRQLEEAHAALLRALQDSGRMPDNTGL